MDVGSATLLLAGTLAILSIIGVPIGLCLAAAGTAYIYLTISVIPVAAGIMFSSLDKTPVLAIPFFIIAAEILSRGGAIKRLVVSIDSLIGHLPGGLAVVAVVSTIIFSAMCGSSIATAAAIGVVVLPELIERGYPRRFSLGLIAMSGGLGILIPPSIPLIIYGLVSNESIGKLFQAGIIPGLLFGLLLCVYVIWRTRAWPETLRDRTSTREQAKALFSAADILLLPIIILGSIYGGILTPTEASAVAVVYALLITAPEYKRQGFNKFLQVVARGCVTSAAILLVLAGAAVFGYAMTDSGIPQTIVKWITEHKLSVIVFLISVNILLLFLGMFLEVISALLITLPIFLPLINMLGIDPIHFAIIMIINMEIAAVTPPIGLNLFTLSAIGKVSVSEVFRGAAPFLVLAFLMLGLITFIPYLSLVLIK
jgi:C4-dicarboxylate transporter DctM subunit